MQKNDLCISVSTYWITSVHNISFLGSNFTSTLGFWTDALSHNLIHSELNDDWISFFIFSLQACFSCSGANSIKSCIEYLYSNSLSAEEDNSDFCVSLFLLLLAWILLTIHYKKLKTYDHAIKNNH